MPVNPKYERGSNNWEKRGRYEVFLDKADTILRSQLPSRIFQLSNGCRASNEVAKRGTSKTKKPLG